MGFFSQKCQGCAHPILSIWASNDVNDWMQQAVAITPNGSVLKGTYDGYGRLDEFEYAVGERNTVWHQACWAVAGSPGDYQGESPYAEDQGFFFEDPDHDLAEPKTREAAK